MTPDNVTIRRTRKVLGRRHVHYESLMELLADETTAAAGLTGLREAIVRLEKTSVLAPHPALGVCSRAESMAFQCRHAELHMSFIVSNNSLPG